jgi:hypothetical protein
MSYEEDRRDLARHEAEIAELERVIDDFVPPWLSHVWGLHSVHYHP